MFSIQQILTFFLALTMELSLTACGREAAVQPAPEPPAQAQETPAQGPSPGASEPELEVTEGTETYRGFQMDNVLPKSRTNSFDPWRQHAVGVFACGDVTVVFIR